MFVTAGSQSMCAEQADNVMVPQEAAELAEGTESASLLERCFARASAQDLNDYMKSPPIRFAQILHAKGLHRGVFQSTLTHGIGMIFDEGSAWSRAMFKDDGDKKKWSDPKITSRWWKASGPEMESNQALRAFVSHGWANPGFQKGIALAMYFRNAEASISMFVSFWVLYFSLNKVSTTSWAASIGIWLSIYTLTTLLYLTILLYGDSIPLIKQMLLAGSANFRYFLDICVINQTNKDKMMKGVYHLAEYVLVAQHLIILCTPVYPTRVWCVCEIATFLHRIHLLSTQDQQPKRSKSSMRLRRFTLSLLVRASSLVRSNSMVKPIQETTTLEDLMEIHNYKIVLLPLFLPKMTLAVSGSFNLWWMCAVILGLKSLLSMSTLILFCILFALLYRHYKNHVGNLILSFAQFELENAQCSSEEDKEVVRFYIETVWVPKDGQDSTRTFERFVQTEVADFVKRKYGNPIAAVMELLKIVTCQLFGILGVVWQLYQSNCGLNYLCHRMVASTTDDKLLLKE